MKGKKKEEAAASAANTSRELSLPTLKIVDYIDTAYPRFSAILERDSGQGIAIEEMDTLQMELEQMLVTIIQRARHLRVESQLLTNNGDTSMMNGGGGGDSMDCFNENDSNHFNPSLAPTATANSYGTVTASSSTKSSTPLNKKLKAFSGKPSLNSPQASGWQSPTATSTFSYIKSSSLAQSSGANGNGTNGTNGGSCYSAASIKEPKSEANQPIVRNDIPDLFWQSVEPYCAPITDEDIRLLETQIETNDRYLNFNKSGLFILQTSY